MKLFASFLTGSVLGIACHKVLTEIQARQGQTVTSQAQATPDVLRFGAPQRFPEVAVYESHALSYDQARKIPLWVAEHITPDNIKGDANRKHSKFKSDPRVPEMYTALNKDYLGSGWSRGHMAPAGDNKHSQRAMDESFYLTNVLPQDLNNNGDFWNRLEIYCRDLTKRYPHVYIVSGPLMLPTVVVEDGKKYIKHQVIGESEVAVPTHLYKIVLVADENDSPTAIGSFVVPNLPIPRGHTLTQYQVPLEYVEAKSGMTFLPKLDRAVPKDLCTVDGCKLMGSDQLELYFIGRKLAGANTLHRMEKVWGELKKKNLEPDDYLKNLYAKKLEEVQDEKTTSTRGREAGS